MNCSTQYHNLNDKTVFITGGASGIGEAMVKAFVLQNAKVAFIDIDDVAGKALSDELGENCWFKGIDVADINALQQAILDAHQYFGGLDVLINNVANDQRHQPEEVSLADWHNCMKVNLDPTFFAAQTAYSLMKHNQKGSIINFSSINAVQGVEQMSGYITAKAGVIGMTKALAHDFGENNIRVNAILPGWVATKRQLSSWLTQEEEEKWMVSMALKKRIEPEDVANLAVFLASDDSALITGQSLAVDGGKT